MMVRLKSWFSLSESMKPRREDARGKLNTRKGQGSLESSEGLLCKSSQTSIQEHRNKVMQSLSANMRVLLSCIFTSMSHHVLVSTPSRNIEYCRPTRG